MYAKMTLHWYQNELGGHLSKHFHCEHAHQGDNGKKSSWYVNSNTTDLL